MQIFSRQRLKCEGKLSLRVKLIIVAPNGVGNYKLVGSVCVSVCVYVYVCPPYLGYGSETKPINFNPLTT